MASAGEEDSHFSVTRTCAQHRPTAHAKPRAITLARGARQQLPQRREMGLLGGFDLPLLTCLGAACLFRGIFLCHLGRENTVAVDMAHLLNRSGARAFWIATSPKTSRKATT